MCLLTYKHDCNLIFGCHRKAGEHLEVAGSNALFSSRRGPRRVTTKPSVVTTVTVTMTTFRVNSTSFFFVYLIRAYMIFSIVLVDLDPVGFFGQE